MSATHTPGPWNVEQRAFPTHVEAADGRAVAKVDCSMTKRDEDRVTGRVEADANLALIAAAPELLAALEGLLSERYALQEPEEFDASGNWTSNSPASIKARAAIAKARGEA